MGRLWFDYLGFGGIIGKIIEQNIASFHCPAISVSATTANRFRTGFKKSVSTVIPVGIDLLQIQSIPPSAITSDLIFVGRLIREKNGVLWSGHSTVSLYKNLRLVMGMARTRIYHSPYS
jgi:hypothetical protein